MFIRLLHKINSFQIFQTLRFAAYILISIVLAKSGAGTNLIGNYEFLLMIGGSAAFFWLGGYLTFYLSKSNKNKDGEQKSWFVTTFNTMLGFNLAVIIFMLALFFCCQHTLFQHTSYTTFFLFLCYHFLNNQTYINEHYLMAKNEQQLLFHYGIINFILIALCAISGYKFVGGINGILLGLCVAMLLKFSFSIYCYLQEQRLQKPTASEIKAFLQQGAIISFSILLGSLGDYLDEYLVRIFFGDSTFAVYKMGAREFPLLQILCNSLSAILVVTIAQQGFQASLAEIKNRTRMLIRVLTPVMCMVVLSGKWLFPFFYNHNFEQSAFYFNLYALLCVSRFLFPQSIIIGLNLNRYLLIASAAETLLHLALSIILVHYFGIIGIIIGFLVSSLLDKILLAIFVYKKTQKQLWHYTPMTDYLLGNLAIIMCVIIASVL